MLLQRETQADLERSDGRNPRKAQAVAVAQAVCADAVALRAPYIAAVEEREDPQRAVVAGTRQRERQLDVADDHLRTADRIAGRRIARTQRARLIAAHRTDTARVVVLEDRVRLAIETVAIAALDV